MKQKYWHECDITSDELQSTGCIMFEMFSNSEHSFIDQVFSFAAALHITVYKLLSN